MSAPDFSQASARDVSEVARSASEAAKIKNLAVEVDRYLAPPGDTPYPLEYAFHLLGDVSGKTVLDYGCGSGEELVPLSRLAKVVIGIDLSPDLIAIAKRRAPGAILEVRSAYDTGLADHSVDAVFCMSLLHHLNIPQAMAEIRRVLKPDGFAIVKEPVRYSKLMWTLRRLFPAQADISENEAPLNQQNIREVTDGFKVVADRHFRLPLVPLLRRFQNRRGLWELDATLLRRLAFLDHYATCRVLKLEKR